MGYCKYFRFINKNKMKNSDKKKGQEWFGGLVLVAGLLFLCRTMGLDLPHWVFTWPMLLVGIGLIIGITHQFKDTAWLILVLIGGLFLVDDITGMNINFSSFIFPAILIAIGLKIIFKKRNKKVIVFDEESGTVVNDEREEDSIEIISIFGGSKKTIISKNFKGGELVSVFGGNELNLTQVDIVRVAKLDILQIMGGTKLIVPSNWKIKSEIVNIFGGFDDKRQNLQGQDTSDKILILEGVSIFGGIDIRSY